MFKPLLDQELKKIVDLQLERIELLLMKNNDVILTVDEEAKEWLVKLGYDITFGARPLKRTIQRHITDPMSEKIISGEILPGDKVNITLEENAQLKFNRK